MRYVLTLIAVVWLTPAIGQTDNRYSLADPSAAPPQPTAEIPALPAVGVDTSLGDLGDFSLPGVDVRQPFDAAVVEAQPAGDAPAAPAVPAQPAATPPSSPNPYSHPSRSVAPPQGTAQSRLASHTDSSLAREMMKRIMQPPEGIQLSGSSLRLADVVAGAASRTEQTRRIEMYWDLCSSVADYNLSLQELDELNRLIALAGGTDRSLSDAVADMRVRVGTSRKAAEANQWRLASAIGRSGPVLPADLLHVGGYDTRYAEIFGSRSSGEAAELNALIPLRHAELLAATQGVLRAEDRLSQVAAGGQASAADIAASMELLALRRRAFVQLAKDYNRRIAHYTELSTPGMLPTRRLVAMLIKTNAAAATASRPTVTPRNPYGPQSSNNSSRSTFVGEWNPPSQAGRAALRDDNVTPAGVNPLRSDERSVLTPPSDVENALRTLTR